jgi:hypothetical protein
MSYTSVLVIPRRKMRLCDALHRRRLWPDSKLHESSWRARRRGEEGEGQEERGRGRAWGVGHMAGGAMGMAAWSSWLPLHALCCSFSARGLLCVREKKRGKKKREEKEKEKEKERKEKRRKRKRKNMVNFLNLKKFKK